MQQCKLFRTRFINFQNNLKNFIQSLLRTFYKNVPQKENHAAVIFPRFHSLISHHNPAVSYWNVHARKYSAVSFFFKWYCFAERARFTASHAEQATALNAWWKAVIFLAAILRFRNARRHSTLFEVLKRAQRRGATAAECISYLLLKRPTHTHKYTIVLIPLQLCSGRKVFALHCRLCCVIMNALNLENSVSLSPSLSITLSAAQSTWLTRLPNIWQFIWCERDIYGCITATPHAIIPRALVQRAKEEIN
jgi:hypothetical protein